MAHPSHPPESDRTTGTITRSTAERNGSFTRFSKWLIGDAVPMNARSGPWCANGATDALFLLKRPTRGEPRLPSRQLCAPACDYVAGSDKPLNQSADRVGANPNRTTRAGPTASSLPQSAIENGRTLARSAVLRLGGSVGRSMRSVGLCLAEASGHAGHDLAIDGRTLLEHGRELASRQHVEVHGGGGGDRGATSTPVEQRHLPDRFPRPDLGHRLPVDGHGGLPVGDHEALTTRPTLGGEHEPGRD